MSVEHLLTDHLGSTSLTTDSSGASVSELRYTPFGEIRYSWTANLSTTPPYTPTRYTFTGQYSYMDDPAPSASQGFGLMFYVSRWYDPSLGRFVQADTLIPESTQGTQAWDRYAYVNNNPVRYVDPSGHMIEDGCDTEGCATDMEQVDWRLRIILRTSKPGDVLQTRLKNSEIVTFVFTYDPNRELILWSVGEGRAWAGIPTLQYLSNNATDAGLFQMGDDGSYTLLRDKNSFIGSLDSSALPYPVDAMMNAHKGIQLGSPDPGSNLPAGFDNGHLFYKKEYNSYNWIKLIFGVGSSLWPPTQRVAPLFIYWSIEDAYNLVWYDWSIVDVTYNPGLNLPYNPLLP
jgi:RHS repeat-associated protein